MRLPDELERFKEQLASDLSPELRPFLDARDGGFQLARELPSQIPADELQENQPGHNLWHRCGLFYQQRQRIDEALAIYTSLYDRLLERQEEIGAHLHKGTPLVRISDCYVLLGHHLLAKRYLMLTACEDAIRDRGEISIEEGGVYFRMVWTLGLPPDTLTRYYHEIWELHQKNPEESRFPEWVLQELDQEWISEFPNLQESSIYTVTSRYVSNLLTQLGTNDGRALERIAHYLMLCIPGCRAYRRGRTKSTDYDVVCSLEGWDVDFRGELGRYVICECKDWDKPADFSTIAKFCLVLQSAKCRLGVLFSSLGVSGTERTEHGSREILKVYQSTGIVVVVISEADLQRVARGANFLTMLRSKYEAVRLDLRN